MHRAGTTMPDSLIDVEFVDGLMDRFLLVSHANMSGVGRRAILMRMMHHSLVGFVLMRVNVISHPAKPHHNSAPRGGCMMAGATEHSLK